MASFRFWVTGPLPGQNEIVKAAKIGGRGGAYAALKAKWTGDIVWCIKAAVPPKGWTRVRCRFDWVSVDKRHDPDNIEAAQKFVWDALTPPSKGKPGVGVIPNDGWNENAGSEHRHEVGAKPGVWVTVTEVEA
jgi:hypothetical protein